MSDGSGAELTPAPDPPPPDPQPPESEFGSDEYVPLNSAVMSPLVLIILYVVTLGFYTPVLAHRFSRVLREPGRPSWYWAVASLIPCLNLWVVYRMAKELEARALRTGMTTTVTPAGSVGLVVVSLVIGATLKRSDNYLVNVAGMFLACLPFVGLQHLLNRIARREAIPVEGGRRRPWFSYGLIPLGLLVHGYLLWDSRDLLHRARGESVAQGDTLHGVSSGYGIRIPADAWVRVKPGTIGDPTSDLELYGPSVTTNAVVYVYDYDNQSMDGHVDDRRRAFGESGETQVEVREERFFHNATDLVPTSVARYEQSATITWVATFDLSPRFVEVIVNTPRFAGYERDAERLVRTVELTETGADPEIAEASGAAGARQ